MSVQVLTNAGAIKTATGSGGGTAAVPDEIQRGTIVIASGAMSNTATINTVGDTGVAELINTGSSADVTAMGRVSIRLALTDTTTVTATREQSGTAATASYQVTTWPADTITQIQRGTVALGAGDMSNTATITAVTDTATSEIFNLGTSADISGNSRACTRVSLTNTTTVTSTREQSGTAATMAFQVSSWS